MPRRLAVLAFVCLAAGALAAQEPDYRALAEHALATTTDPDTRFRLQIVAGRYAEALQSLHALPPNVANVRWEIYANAKATGGAFDHAFAQTFRETLRDLDDKTAFRVLWSFGTPLGALQNQLRDALAHRKDDIDLLRKYFGVQAFTEMAPLLPALRDEDDRRRYVVARDVPFRTPDGATVCTLVVRPRTARKLPALLNFTIYNDPAVKFDEAVRAASNGFAGVVGLTRGKGCSPDRPVPYEHDGADAAALIDWIASQPWSDGRVGMYGGSYEGMTTWAAAKHMPKALKGIMNGAPVAPGLDVPMEGNVFWNFLYPWPFYTMNNKTLDDATYGEAARWQRIDREFYTRGGAYRDLEKIDGTPNPIFGRWIAHPSYDAYWQAMIPYGKEFARVGIPVLTTAGYYFGGPGAAVYYFTEHTKQRPGAEHYLLIGPWDHVRGHSGTIGILGTKTMTSLAGYELEPAAHIDMGELGYQWFDYVFGRGPKPAILADRVNYMVVGANKWEHAPSIAAMSSRRMKIPVSGTLTVDLADRSDVGRPRPGGGVIDKDLDTSYALRDPMPSPIEASGLFSGHLDFITNKKDFDFQVTLFELTPAGEYVLLAPYWSRASYNGHPETRRLLEPGKRQTLDFRAIRLMSRRVGAGSRIVVVLGVIKELGRQIDYGSGKEVSDETRADAGEPLRIEWLAGSFVTLPVR
jgi:predicted acyl esterase